MPEGRRLRGLEVAGGRAGKAVERRLTHRHGSRTHMIPKPRLTKCTLVMAIKLRRFDRVARMFLNKAENKSKRKWTHAHSVTGVCARRS
jgi:hypothetical protein